MKTGIILFSALVLLTGCSRKEEIKTEEEPFHEQEDLKNFPAESFETDEAAFPKTGKSTEDFITDPKIYEIQYEAEGDLNGDHLEDVVVVRKDKINKTAIRYMLVLLQNPDRTYRLDKVSQLVMPIEYNDSDFKIYETEDVSIKKGILSIQLYGIGPSGNLFSNFKYFGKDLLLTDIETYNMGAGSHQSLNYDVMKGELIQEITNTMEEEMPSTEKIYHLKKQKLDFENADPEKIITDAYKQIDEA